MRVVIVDDEPPARDRLAQLLQELEGWESVGLAGNGSEALTLCAQHKPDVVLMDVRMPGMDGIEAARHLGAMEEPPAVIFTTAFDEYAIDAFDAQAVGYLMKPVRKERLARALRHAARLSRPQLAAVAAESVDEGRRTRICARVGEQLRLIPVEDILYFQADQKYVCVHHAGGQELIDESLKALAEEFAPEFLRIHRNALVSVKHIDAVEKNADGGYFARLKGRDELLAVSRRHATELRKRLRSS